MIRKLKDPKFYGYMVLDDNSHAGVAVYYQEGVHMGTKYKKIRISEVFLTKKTKELRFTRRKNTDYEYRKGTHYQRASLLPHLLPEFIQACEMLTKEIGLTKIEAPPETASTERLEGLPIDEKYGNLAF